MVDLRSIWQRRCRYPAGARSRGGSREAGYNLVVLVVMITVLNIVIAKALPLWSTAIQREKEAELIFRGLQYAEAIRVFESRHGRLPVRLEELVEVEPRSIRQLWTNPMNEDGGWGLIFQNQPNQPNQPNQRNRRNQRAGEGQDQSQADQRRFGVPGNGKEVKVGPIFGVYSQEGGKAIKVFTPNPNAPGGGGSSEISEWRFTVDLAKVLVRGIDPQNPIAPSMNAADLGKPWPPGVQPQVVPTGGQQGGGSRSGGTHAIQKPGQPNRTPGQQPRGGSGG